MKPVPTKARLELFLRGVKQKDIAQVAGVDVGYVNKCVNGLKEPSKKVIEAAKAVTGINLFEEEVK